MQSIAFEVGVSAPDMPGTLKPSASHGERRIHMKRTSQAAGVAVVTAAFIGGLAPAASASTESKAGGAEAAIAIIESVYSIGEILQGPALNSDVTLRNTTGKTLQIVAVSQPYQMRVTTAVPGSQVRPGEGFAVGFTVERDSAGQLQRDAGVTVVVRTMQQSTLATGAYGKYGATPTYGPERSITIKTVNYEESGAYRINGRGLTTGDAVIVKIDGAIVAGVERSSRNVLPSLGVVNVS